MSGSGSCCEFSAIFVPAPALALGFGEAILLTLAFYLVNAPVAAARSVAALPVPAQTSLAVAAAAILAMVAVGLYHRDVFLDARLMAIKGAVALDAAGAGRGGGRLRRIRCRAREHAPWLPRLVPQGEPRMDGLGCADPNRVPALCRFRFVPPPGGRAGHGRAGGPYRRTRPVRREPLVQGQGIRPCLRRSAHRYGRAARSRPGRRRVCPRALCPQGRRARRSWWRPTSAAACPCCSFFIARSRAST